MLCIPHACTGFVAMCVSITTEVVQAVLLLYVCAAIVCVLKVKL